MGLDVTSRRPVWGQYLMPKKALTQFGGWVAGTPMGVITTAIIADFVQRYEVFPHCIQNEKDKFFVANLWHLFVR